MSDCPIWKQLTLRRIARWKNLIVTDLTNAFYQIPLAKQSMKYCGVATPFRGVRACTSSNGHARPGFETALEELMCRVLGKCLQDGIAAKLADDLYCGADTPRQILHLHTSMLLKTLSRNPSPLRSHDNPTNFGCD